MFSKVLLFASYLVIANAGVLSGPAIHAPTSYGVNTGFSTVSRTQDAHGNYAFGYDVTGHLGAKNSREERGDGYGNVMGSYSLADIDGRQRRVDYVADALGFRANVATNEPGTLPTATGGAIVNGGAAPFKAPLAAAGLAAPLAAPAIIASGPAIGYNGGHGFAAHGLNGHGLGGHLGMSYNYGISHAAPVAYKGLAAPIAAPIASYGNLGAY